MFIYIHKINCFKEVNCLTRVPQLLRKQQKEIREDQQRPLGLRRDPCYSYFEIRGLFSFETHFVYVHPFFFPEVTLDGKVNHSKKESTILWSLWLFPSLIPCFFFPLHQANLPDYLLLQLININPLFFLNTLVSLQIIQIFHLF